MKNNRIIGSGVVDGQDARATESGREPGHHMTRFEGFECDAGGFLHFNSMERIPLARPARSIGGRAARAQRSETGLTRPNGRTFDETL